MKEDGARKLGHATLEVLRMMAVNCPGFAGGSNS